jgi:D-cysteine desulfhydrase
VGPGFDLPRFRLTDLPTPVRRLRALECELGATSLWVKCDDRSGPLYGGNKPRKLEYLVAHALQRGRTGLLTTGGTGTHHGLATAIAAREAGLRAALVLLPQPVTAHVRESLLLLHAYGAELHLAESIAAVAGRVLILLARANLRGAPLELIPTGGSNARGTVGFVRAGLELAAQVQAGELPEPAAVFTALGSGGTAAGLLAGLRAGGLRSRVVAVLATHTLIPTERRLTRLARAALHELRAGGAQLPPVRFSPGDLEIVHDYLGAGYGIASAAGDAATLLARQTEAIDLEVTYTAKAFAAFADAARTRRYGEHLLFWNTFTSVDPRAGLDRLPEPFELPNAFHRFFDGDSAA